MATINETINAILGEKTSSIISESNDLILKINKEMRNLQMTSLSALDNTIDNKTLLSFVNNKNRFSPARKVFVADSFKKFNKRNNISLMTHSSIPTLRINNRNKLIIGYKRINKFSYIKYSQAKCEYNKQFNLDYFCKLEQLFVNNNYKFLDITHKKHFDMCLRINKRIIRKSQLFDYYNYCGRWPSKFYSKIYFEKKNLYIKKYNRQQQLARIEQIKQNNRFSTLKEVIYSKSSPLECDGPSDRPLKCFRPRKEVSYSFDDILDNYKDCIEQPHVEEVVIPRNPRLLQRLKTVLFNFWYNRCSKLIQYYYNPIIDGENSIEMETVKTNEHDPEFYDCEPSVFCAREGIDVDYSNFDDIDLVVAQMDDLKQSNVEQDKSGNVVLTSQTETEEINLPTDSMDNHWIDMSISDKINDIPTISERWLNCKTFEWDTTQIVDTALHTVDLPCGIFTTNEATNPALMMFNQHALWKGDMVIRIKVNSNQFYLGQLIVSWYYSANYDLHKSHRDNIWSCVQLPHVKLSASDNNDVQLTIPYRSYRSFLTTYKRTGDSNPLYLGTLSIRVLNQLQVKDNVSKLTGYMYLKFVNNNFACPMPRMAFIQGEMLPIKSLVKVAEKSLNVLDKFVNMDKPTLHTMMNYKVLTPSDSWSTMKNDVSALHTLRSDPSGQTPHISGSTLRVDQTQFSFLKKQYGLIMQHKWKTSQTTGTQICTIPATPVLQDKLPKVACTADGIAHDTWVLPPITALANVNAYWRGDIILHFEFINSIFQTGSLLIAYVPRTITTALTIEYAKQCYHAVLDIGARKEYTLCVPYIADKPWWPRYRNYINSSKVDIDPPGNVYIFVLNQLTVMDSLPSTIDFNIYMCGADNMEFSVPVAPTYMPLLDGTYLVPKVRDVKPKPGYFTDYIGTGSWRYAIYVDAEKKTSQYVKVVRYGNGSDHIMQFTDIDSYTIYQAATGSTITELPSFNVNENQLSNKYFCRLIVNGDRGAYNYMCAFYNIKSAVTYINEWKKQGDPLSDSPLKYCNYCTESKYLNIKPNDTFILMYSTYTPINRIHNDFELVEPNMDEIKLTSSTLKSTNDGFVTFGETFNSIKDYCRRYQLYSHVEINMKRLDQNGRRMAIHASMPILPIGLVPDGDVLSSKYGREGIIPFLLSCYRFYRGSLNFRIVAVPSLSSAPIMIIHRPNTLIDTRSLRINTEIDRATKIVESGFASTMLIPTTNCVTTIQIPYYNPSNMSLLQRPDFAATSETLHYGMGDLAFSVLANNSAGTVEIYTYYSLADDMDLSDFVGFSPMTTLIKPDVKDDVKYENTIDIKRLNIVEPQAPGIIQKFKNSLSGYLEASVVKSATASIREKNNLAFDDVSSTTEQSLISLISDLISAKCSEYKNEIINVVINILHCINNPQPMTFAIAAVGIILTIFPSPYECYDKLMDCLKNIWSWIAPESADSHKTEKESSNICSLLRTIGNVICSTLGYPISLVKSIPIPDFGAFFYRNIKNLSQTVNSVITMFRNLIDVFKSMFNWIVYKFNKTRSHLGVITNEDAVVERWIIDSEDILHPNLKEKILSSTKQTMKLEVLHAMGTIILTKLRACANEQDVKIKPNAIKLYTLVLQLHNKLNKLRDEIVNSQMSGLVRFEPYVISISGEGQIGKTFITDNIASALITHNNISVNGSISYVRPPGNKYWNSLSTQPVLVYDDFLHIINDEYAVQDIAELIIIKSKAIFNPPQASVDEKKIRYNPKFVILNTNNPWFECKSVNSQKSWRGRRDIMIHVDLAPDFIRQFGDDIKKLYTYNSKAQKQIAEFKHLQFYVFNNTIDAPKLQDNARYDVKNNVFIPNPDNANSTSFTYIEIMKYIKQHSAIYIKKETLEYTKRMSELAKFQVEDNTIEFNINSYGEFIDKLNAQYEGKDPMFSWAKEKMSCNNIQSEMGNHKKITINDTDTQATTSDNVDIDDTDDEILNSDNKCIHSFMLDNIYNYVVDQGFTLDCKTYAPEMICTSNCIFTTQKEFDKWIILNYERHREVYFDKPKILRKIINTPNTCDPKYVEQYKTIIAELGIHKELIHQTFWGKVGCKVKQVLKWIAWALGMIATVYGITLVTHKVDNFLYNKVPCLSTSQEASKWVKRVYDIPVKPIEEEMAYDNNKSIHKKPTLTNVKVVEGQQCEAIESTIRKKLSANTFFIRAITEDNKEISVRCLGLSGHYAVAIDHYFHTFKNFSCGTKFSIMRPSLVTEINYHDIKQYKLQNSALMLLQLPAQFNPFSNIVKYFISHQASHAINNNIKIFEFDIIEKDNNYGWEIKIHNDYISELCDKLAVPSPVNEHEDTIVNKVFRYKTSGKGKCGSIIVTDINHTQSIVGIHIAGYTSGSTGFCEAIVAETFENAIESLQTKFITTVSDVQSESPYITNNYHPKIQLFNNVEILGSVKPKYAYNAPKKTKLVHSTCYNAITQSTYDFPILSNNDNRCAHGYSPFVEGCKYHGEPPCNFTISDLNVAKRHLEEKIVAKCKPIKKVGVLTREQAIIGLQLPGYEAMEFSTSEGFPFSSYRPQGANDKKWLFDLTVGERYILHGIHPMLEQAMDEKHLLRKKHILPFTVFIDCLKDAKLPIEKLQPRIFSVSPCDFTIQFRQYFLDFCVAYQYSMFDVESAVGINVDSIQWTDMVYRLNNNSPLYVCGDYSKFGPRLMGLCIYNCIQIIINWYIENGDNNIENANIRYIMGLEMQFSVHLMLNFLYRTITGSPSGSPITTILNNMVNCLYIRIAYINILSEEFLKNLDCDIKYVSYKSLYYFDQYVCLICYGDDLIMTVDKQLIDIFNCTNLSKFFSLYDIKFTDAQKSKDIQSSFNHIFSESTTFLKRNIKKHPRRPTIYVGAMATRAIEETCNWCYQNNNLQQRSIEACQDMLLNAHGHGPIYYMNLRKRVLSYWATLNIYVSIPTWDDVDYRIYNEYIAYNLKLKNT